MTYRQYPPVPKICQQCAGNYLANYYHAKRSRYCSRTCAGLARRKPPVDTSTIDEIALLREYLSYDASTGHLTWIKRPSYRAPVGRIAGCLMAHGYLRFKFRHIDTTCHRAAWAHFYGEWPTAELDHINGIRSDNRISNLRLATRNQNSYNQVSRSKSGFKGVWQKGKRFRACITKNYKTIHIGTFNTIEEAVNARRSKELELSVQNWCNSRT